MVPQMDCNRGIYRDTWGLYRDRIAMMEKNMEDAVLGLVFRDGESNGR